MHKQRTTAELIHDLSLKLWEAHWKWTCGFDGCEVCMLLADVKEMNEEMRVKIEVKGICKGCGRPVPSGYFECDGGRSHQAIPARKI